jgi:hypothetical protein
MSVSHPSAGLPLQFIKPGVQDPSLNAHASAVHEAAPLTCARSVQSLPQAPQLWMSLGTHAMPHASFGEGHDPESDASLPEAKPGTTEASASCRVASGSPAPASTSAAGAAASSVVASAGPRKSWSSFPRMELHSAARTAQNASV